MISELRYHTRNNHDFHMTRFKRCVYYENGCLIMDGVREMEHVV